MDHGGDESHPTGRLACQACQRKKIKCDRTYPCGQCTRSNLTCHASTRKQRARHAGKRGVDSELKNRISKLESLVESLSGDVATGHSHSSGDSETSPPESAPVKQPSGSAAAPSMRKYVASPFWTSLTSEVQALREALEEEEPEGDTPESAVQEPSPPAGSELSNIEYDLIVCPPGRIYVMPGGFAEPTEKVASQILDAYLSNVEPIFRLFHTPTLVSFMRDGSSYLGQPWDAPGNQALKRAVWMAGVNSLSEQECLEVTGENRMDAMNHYRRLVGISLAQADLVNTTDLATLQAFVTYLTASRTTDTTRRMWTLLAIVVRIATAMNLHREPSKFCTYYSAFQRELRRRLWWRIRYLDVFSSIDRGSELLISSESYSVQYPTLTNDDTFDENSTEIPALENCETDLSFTNVCFEACVVIESLLRPEIQPSGETWEKRHQLALDFGKRVDEKYLQYYNKGTPFHGFCAAVCESMKASMVLRAVRPMQRHVSSTPPRVDSPYVLRIAMNNLSASERIYATKGADRFKWQVWVQWHALAVALAGLCSIRNTPLAEEAWYYVERQYERSAQYVADSKNGMLWRPVERLYKKATAFRDAVPSQIPKYAPDAQQDITLDSTNSAIQPSFDAFNPFSGVNNYGPFPSTTFPPTTFPTPPSSTIPTTGTGVLDPTTAPANNLPMSSMSLDPSSNMVSSTQNFSPTQQQQQQQQQVFPNNNVNNFDPFAVDPSWIDWEQIMNDYADTGDLMAGVQTWPYEGGANGQNGNWNGNGNLMPFF